MIEVKDKQLECTKCGRTFTFTAKEAQSFLDKGLTNEPKKCLDCRAAERAKKQQKIRDEVQCVVCQASFSVPFTPPRNADGTLRRPLYCVEHFETRQTT